MYEITDPKINETQNLGTVPPMENETSVRYVPPMENETSVRYQNNTFEMPTDVMPYSGLPESYRDTLLSFVMPQLQDSVANMPKNIDDYTQNALGSYRQEFDRMIKEMLPKQIGRLANRGILNSSVASDTMSKAVSDMASESASKGYETAMKSALLKVGIPDTLAGLLQYGQSSQDPTVMYRTMADLLVNL